MTLTLTQDIFEKVLARPVLADTGQPDAALVHLWWSAPLQDELIVHVFLDGQWVDASEHPQQHELWLMCDRRQPHRIELLASSVSEAGQALERPAASNLRSWNPPVKDSLEVQLLRDPNLPADTTVEVRVDSVVQRTVPLWGDGDSRGGMGAIFGEGAFGDDQLTGPGLGLGELGAGPLGVDGEAWTFRQCHVPAGPHTLELRGVDPQGHTLTPTRLFTFEADSLPTPAHSFKCTPDFKLTWT